MSNQTLMIQLSYHNMRCDLVIGCNRDPIYHTGAIFCSQNIFNCILKVYIFGYLIRIENYFKTLMVVTNWTIKYKFWNLPSLNSSTISTLR